MRSPTRERRDRADNRRDVFINCPFSSDYQVNFQAIVFTVVRSGFKPRFVLGRMMTAERSDSIKSAKSFSSAPLASTIFQRRSPTRSPSCRALICLSSLGFILVQNGLASERTGQSAH